MTPAFDRNRPFGSETWQTRTAGQLGLMNTLRPKGRPKKEAKKAGDTQN